jgi:hypothetical protein
MPRTHLEAQNETPPPGCRRQIPFLRHQAPNQRNVRAGSCHFGSSAVQQLMIFLRLIHQSVSLSHELAEPGDRV